MEDSTARNDSAEYLTGRPREGSGAPLSGRVVLLPRLKEGDRIASALERAGARVLRAAVTRTVPGDAADHDPQGSTEPATTEPVEAAVQPPTGETVDLAGSADDHPSDPATE